MGHVHGMFDKSASPVVFCPKPRRICTGLNRKLILLKRNVHTHIHTRMNAMTIRYV